MIKILQVMGCLEKGGTENFVMELYRRIDRSKFQFDFYILNPQYISVYVEEIESLGGHVYKGEPLCLNNTNRGVRALRKVLRECGPYDVVHSHVNVGNALVLYVAKIEKVNVRISHSHAIYKKEKNPCKRLKKYLMERLLLYSATNRLACSEEAGRSLYGNNSIIIVNNGIDYNKFLRKQDSETNALLMKYCKNLDFAPKCIWGNITRFDENKNQLFILEVFKEYLKFDPNSLLVLGGYNGGTFDMVKDRSKTLGLENKVLFIGVQDNIEDWLGCIDLYIFPSRHEGFGIALLEAEISGCRCYSSKSVPKSTDLGLGTVEYLELNKGPKYWAEFIHNDDLKDRKTITKEQIVDAVIRRKLSIESTVSQMENLYEK